MGDWGEGRRLNMRDKLWVKDTVRSGWHCSMCP